MARKERAGDFRTPEGSYRLTRRNTRSDFFLSIQVSYPNEQDMQRARRNGWQPGGSIMIHGLPNDPRHTPDYYASQDWTDGCIAVTNADMVEIWMMTSDNVRDRHPALEAGAEHQDLRPVEYTAHHKQGDEQTRGDILETSIVIPDFVDARIGPRGSLENLSQAEIEKLLDSRAGGLYPLFRKCALAVLNSGSETDNAKEIFDRYKDFEVELVRQAWGIKLEIKNAPGQAFVDGEMIRGMKEHVFAVLRDVIFISNEIIESGRFDLDNPAVDHQRRVPHPAQRADPRLQVASRISWCAGAVTRSAPRNTSTPRRWATSSACAAWTSARAAARAP